MPLPLIPIIKILALGSLKIVFLLFGAAFFPILSLRFILTGAYGMLLPTLDWLEENQRLDAKRHRDIVDDLTALAKIEFTRAEARHQLLTLMRKTVTNMGTAIIGIPASIQRGIAFLTGKQNK